MRSIIYWDENTPSNNNSCYVKQKNCCKYTRIHECCGLCKCTNRILIFREEGEEKEVSGRMPPATVSTDGRLGFVLKTYSSNWVYYYKVFSKMLGTTILGCLWYAVVPARMSIACVRANHQCLCGSRIPCSKTNRRRQSNGVLESSRPI